MLVMAHLVGINKGPVMDWINDSGLDEHFRKWKKQLEILFRGPLGELTDAVKCNYVICNEMQVHRFFNSYIFRNR